MNKTISALLLFVLLFINLQSCDDNSNSGCVLSGNGVIKTESRETDSISTIYLACPGNLYVSQGQVSLLSVTSDENILPEIKTEIISGVLRITSLKSLCFTKMDVHATMNRVDKIVLESSGNITGETAINANDMELQLSGAGNIDLNGTAHSCLSTLDGAGNINLLNLQTVVSTVVLNGSGNIRIWATEKIEVILNGSGNVYYKGNPSIKKITVNGSGNVVQLP
jgi:hypothetical protein